MISSVLAYSHLGISSLSTHRAKDEHPPGWKNVYVVHRKTKDKASVQG